MGHNALFQRENFDYKDIIKIKEQKNYIIYTHPNRSTQVQNFHQEIEYIFLIRNKKKTHKKETFT